TRIVESSCEVDLLFDDVERVVACAERRLPCSSAENASAQKNHRFQFVPQCHSGIVNASRQRTFRKVKTITNATKRHKTLKGVQKSIWAFGAFLFTSSFRSSCSC